MRLITDDQARRNIAANLKRLMAAAGYSTRDVAERLKCSHGAISQYTLENKLPSAATLARLAQLFDVTADELLEPAAGRRRS